MKIFLFSVLKSFIRWFFFTKKVSKKVWETNICIRFHRDMYLYLLQPTSLQDIFLIYIRKKINNNININNKNDKGSQHK